MFNDGVCSDEIVIHVHSYKHIKLDREMIEKMLKT